MQKPTLIKLSHIASLLKPRAIDANKGDFGHILMIGGDYNMAGAVMMSCEAAFRLGAGRVTVLTRHENFQTILARLPNAMTEQIKNPGEILQHFTNKTAIAIGMGLGKSNWAQDLLHAALSSNLPKIIDADALNLIAQNKISNLNNSIITPHPLEAARLLEKNVEEIQQDRVLAVKQLQQKYNAVTVLKGHDSLIADNSQIALCQFGNPGMAVAGMGDVLSGMIAAFVAQRFSLFDAACAGVTIHALASDMAAKQQGQIGILPTEILHFARQIINHPDIYLCD